MKPFYDPFLAFFWGGDIMAVRSSVADPGRISTDPDPDPAHVNERVCNFYTPAPIQ